MSEKQDFNKGANLRQIAEKRRERWLSRKILSEIIDAVRKQRDDANWIIYQILKKDSENLTYKSKIKMFNWLANSGYDVEKLRPEKEDKVTSYQEAWQEYKDQSIYAMKFQKAVEENYKLCQELNEANELLKDLYTHLTEKGVQTAWETLADANSWGKIIDKIKKRVTNEKIKKTNF